MSLALWDFTRESLTLWAEKAGFYGDGHPVRDRRKYIALAGIVHDLPSRLVAAGISAEVTNMLTNSVQLDAERLRLSFRGGWSWESVRVERESHRQAYA